MKNFFSLMTLVIVISSFYACSQHDELAFDPEMDIMTKEQVNNLSEVANRIGDYMRHSDIATRDGEFNECGEEAQLLSDFIYETELCLSCVGFSNEDLAEMKAEYGDYAMTAIGLWILDQERETNNISQTRSDVVDCLLMAVGADVFSSIGSTLGTSWKMVSKKVVKTALKQAAKYFIGPVGALVAVGEFTLCMATN